MAMSYGHVYVARVAFGAQDQRRRSQALREAEAYPGPSLIIAYSHCIAHGYDLVAGRATSRSWRSTPASGRSTASTRGGSRRASRRSSSTRRRPRIKAADYMRNEARFRMVEKLDPERFRRLSAAAEREATRRFDVYRQLAGLHVPAGVEAAVSEPEVPPAAPPPRARLAVVTGPAG